MNYNAQLKAWALDRAIETIKISGGDATPEKVIEIATKYCDFTAEPANEEEPQYVEAANV